MPIYKEDNKYFVKICINGKQILLINIFDTIDTIFSVI